MQPKLTAQQAYELAQTPSDFARVRPETISNIDTIIRQAARKKQLRANLSPQLFADPQVVEIYLQAGYSMTLLDTNGKSVVDPAGAMFCFLSWDQPVVETNDAPADPEQDQPTGAGDAGQTPAVETPPVETPSANSVLVVNTEGSGVQVGYTPEQQAKVNEARELAQSLSEEEINDLLDVADPDEESEPVEPAEEQSAQEQPAGQEQAPSEQPSGEQTADENSQPPLDPQTNADPSPEAPVSEAPSTDEAPAESPAESPAETAGTESETAETTPAPAPAPDATDGEGAAGEATPAGDGSESASGSGDEPPVGEGSTETPADAPVDQTPPTEAPPADQPAPVAKKTSAKAAKSA